MSFKLKEKYSTLSKHVMVAVIFDDKVAYN